MAAQTPAAYNKWLAITKSDTVAIGETTAGDGNAVVPDAIFVGGAGNVVAVSESGDTVTFTAVAGSTILIRPKRGNSTSTTATAMVALFQV